LAFYFNLFFFLFEKKKTFSSKVEEETWDRGTASSFVWG
jgi:hypothetical protein